MKLYELSICANYVSDWTYVQALRELFQNAIDRETTCEESKMLVKYDSAENKLVITSKNSSLDIKTLLLGNTSKESDKNTIGKFGEGYKLAALALLRENKTLTIRNMANKEVWDAKIVVSKLYKENVLGFEVSKSESGKDLIIEVGNITKEEYDKCTHMYLGLCEINESDIIKTEYGNILLNENQRGSVYVNGLFVTKNSGLKYGYSLKPSQIKLDRDRRMVSDFEIAWCASKMWTDSNSINNPDELDNRVKLIRECLEEKCMDVQYVNMAGVLRQEVKEKIAEEFVQEYGKDAVPITSTYELNTLDQKNTAVIVSEGYKQILESSGLIKEPEKRELEPIDELKEWIENIRHKLDTVEYNLAMDIIGRL